MARGRVGSEHGRGPFGELGEDSEKTVRRCVEWEEYRGDQRYPVYYISSIERAQKRGQDIVTNVVRIRWRIITSR